MEHEMRKILIVGEFSSVREFIAEELAGEGHLVAAISNPAMIGELLTTLEPDLVLLGFHIHGMDQWDASMEIKRQAPHLPVLTFTAYGIGKEKIRLIVRNGYEIKSFSLEILKQKVAELLRRKPIQDFKGGERRSSPHPNTVSLYGGEGSSSS
jgi:CheY-like chemotaxis protein